MEETLLQKAQRLGIKPGAAPAQATPAPTAMASEMPALSGATETLAQKAQRLGIAPANPTAAPAFRYEVPVVQETREAKKARYQAEADQAAAEAKKANSFTGFMGNFGKALVENIAPSEVGLGKTMGATFFSNRDQLLKFNDDLIDQNIALRRKIKEKEAAGEDVTRFKRAYNSNQDLIDANNKELGDERAALPSTAKAVGQLAGTALDVLSAGTYGKAASTMRSGELFSKAKGALPTVVEGVKEIAKKPVSLFSKEGAKSVAKGAGLGYAYDVTQGMQGGRGEDRDGMGALIPGLGTIIGAGLPTLSAAAQSGKNALSKEVQIAKTIAKREEEILNIENNYAKTRKNMSFSKDQGAESRKRVASTDVLANSIDQEGTIRTKQKGGAVDQYKAMTLDGAEGVVRKNLENEGATISVDQIRQKLESNIMNSGLEGKALKNALAGIDGEIEGLMLRASPDGKIPLAAIHDAKISTTNGINYMTEPFVKSERKAVANAYKVLVEDNSKFQIKGSDGKMYGIKDINGELSKYLKDIELLESLDGKKVKGGKLGKYFAQISGNIVGGIAGNAVGGPVGSALGTIIGGELGGRIKGNILKGTLGGVTGKVAPRSSILDKAVEAGNKKKLKVNSLPSLFTNELPMIDAGPSPVSKVKAGMSKEKLPTAEGAPKVFMKKGLGNVTEKKPVEKLVPDSELPVIDAGPTPKSKFKKEDPNLPTAEGAPQVYENKRGNLNANQSKTTIANKTDIKPIVPPNKNGASKGMASLNAIFGTAGAGAAAVALSKPSKMTYEKPVEEAKAEAPKEEPKGDISKKNNNPGNLIFMGQEGAKQGDKRPDGTYWAVFETPEAGYKAMSRDISAKLGRKPEMTLRDLINTRSPESDGNNLHDILYNISDELFDIKGPNGSIINGKTLVKDIPMDRLARAIAKSEGFKD